MNCLVFDSGPLISLAENGLLHVLPKLKKAFSGKFILPQGVYDEVVKKGMTIHRFKLEALKVTKLIEDGVFEVANEKEITRFAKDLERAANSIISARGHPVQILQEGELEVIAAACVYDADAIIIDELVTRLLIEDPNGLKRIMARRLHTQVKVNKNALEKFQSACKGRTVLRSTELLTVALERGLLEEYVVKKPGARKELLEGLLWGAKLHGCSITVQEIETLLGSFSRK